MSTPRTRGVVVPILTPMTPDESVDVASLRRLVNHLIESGVHAIWAAGTTGEFAALTADEQVKVIGTVAEQAAGRVPVIGNISAAGTKLAVELGRAVQEMELDGVAATPPYYFPGSQDELLAHYRYIKEQVGLPLWVYNIPQTVKTIVEPATIATLAGEGTVVGIKDSSGAGEPLAQLNVLCEQGDIELVRLLGTIYRTTRTRALGAHGIVPGLDNVAPGIVARAWEAGEAGDEETARRYDAKLIAADRVTQFVETGGPTPSRLSELKSVLKVMGVLDHDTVSRPMTAMTEEAKQAIPAALKELDALARE